VQEGVAIVGASTLRLHVELSPAYLEAGEPLSVRAFLQDKGQLVRDVQQGQGQTVSVELTTPQGEKATFVLTPHSDGAFVGLSPALYMSGHYGLTVTATMPTLQRQRTLSFVVHPLCFQATVASAAPATARLVLTDACPPFTALTIEAEHTTESRTTQRIALTSPRQGVFEASIPPLTAGQAGQITLHIHGHPTGQDPFILVKGPWPLPVIPASPPASPPQSPASAPREAHGHDVAAGALRKLLVLNGMLVLIGGIGYGLYRSHSQHKKMPHARHANGGSSDLDSSLSPHEPNS
jgi:hypothetical protein